ncbi:MAG: TIGR04002 family protein [Lachnospiraceae bacterium]|nr:TIGR04002 family protein [Lachnospiraceae bacterium]
MNQKKSLDIRLLTFAALFAALIAVVTSFIRIPAAHNGYTHAGDSMIYLAACILPPGYSVAAAAVGGFMADILAGAPEWAIATAIIKSFNILPFIASRYFLKKLDKDDKILHPANIAMLIPTSIVTVVGYFLAEGIMYGFEVSLFSAFVGGWIQPLAGAIVYLTVGVSLDAMKFKSKVYPKLLNSSLSKGHKRA